MKKSLLIIAGPRGLIALGIMCLIILLGTALSLFAVRQVISDKQNEITNGIIVIDPGHGGVDGGTNSKDFLEKEVNLEVAKKLQSVLLDRGAKVVMTREQDVSPGNTGPDGKQYSYKRSLYTRVVIIENNKPDVFLSIHVNASYRRTPASGSIVYFNKALHNADVLAETLQKHLNAVAAKHGFTEHRPKSANFYILRNTSRPGTVVEIGFMTNNPEKALLKQDRYQWELARAMADGLNQYFSEKSP